MTGFEQRAGAAMFQARRDTCSGEASRKPRISPPLEKCSPIARTHDDAHRGLGVERLERSAQLVALRHRNDVQGRPVEHDVGALALGVGLDAKPVERCWYHGAAHPRYSLR